MTKQIKKSKAADAAEIILPLQQHGCAYSFRRSGRAQRLRLSLVGNFVEVVAPHKMPMTHISKFVESKLPWVQSHLAQCAQQAEKTGIGLPTSFGHGAVLPILGEPTTLTLLTEGRGIEWEPSALYIMGCNASVATVAEQLVRSRLTVWLKSQARTHAQSFIDELTPRLGLQPSSLRITSAASRWGSCNSKGAIALNWRLMMAPAHIFRYVVAHELAHLKHLNHSPAFWQTVAQMDADYKLHRNWLKVYGHLLQNPAHPDKL